MTIPVANFSASITNLIVSFTDMSSGIPTSWLWDFGDPITGVDNISILQNPIHTFSDNGVFTVTLTSTNGSGSNSISKTIKISKTSENINVTGFQKLTFETDNTRIAFKPNIIKDSTGRIIIIYHKLLVTGKTSGGEVSISSGFNLAITSGSGKLNGITKTWSSDSLLAVPTLLQLVYCDPTSVGNGIGITSDLNMTFMKSIIPISFVLSGASSIVRLIPIENIGNYIYARRQKSDGFGGWIWDDYEDILNSGEDPFVFYDSILNVIYINYTRNGSIYQRKIQVGSENISWTYIEDYIENAGTLIPDDFVNELDISISGMKLLTNDITNTSEQLYQFIDDSTHDSILASGMKLLNDSNIQFGGSFIYEKLSGIKTTFNSPGYSDSVFVFLPLIKVSSTSPIIYFNSAFYEIYSADNTTLLESIPYSSNIGSWKNIDIYNGQRIYLGFRGTYSVYTNGTNFDTITLSKLDRFPIDVTLNYIYSEDTSTKYTYITELVREIIPSGLSLISSPITSTSIQLFEISVENTIDVNSSILPSGIPLKTVLV